MWDKADLHPRENILRTGGVDGCGVNEKAKIYIKVSCDGLFQAQVLHPILDVHVLSQIVNRFGDKLGQPGVSKYQ